MRVIGLFAMLAVGAVCGSAQSIFHTSPDWVSADRPVSTGAALADLNGDGWLDLVVANGNDMARQRLAVYHNQGDGTLPLLPTWQSADIAYNGHLDVADVDGDGWLDVAVAVLGTGSSTGPVAKLYQNVGGVLSSNPVWESELVGNAFGVAFGDMDNDGRPDLAVATGWPYSNPNRFRNVVHRNVDGQLATAATWQSSDQHDTMSPLWVDADRDGWLDLIFTGANTYTWLYHNEGGTLNTVASWRTDDVAGQFAIMATVGDVTGDGLDELFVTDNTQLFGGTGWFRQYNGLEAGYFSATPDWYYYNAQHAYGAAVALADINADGLLDLATGAWWSRTRIFLNGGTGFTWAYAWLSTPATVVEKIVFGDIDKNALYGVEETFSAAAGEQLFELGQQPIQEIVGVYADEVELTPAEYACSREHGWVTVGPAASEVRVAYRVSSRLDMAVTNWDDTVGNHVYYNLLVTAGDANCDGRVNALDISPFVLLLTDLPAYEANFPDCDGALFCDMNEDGAVNALDINPFVRAMTGS